MKSKNKPGGKMKMILRKLLMIITVCLMCTSTLYAKTNFGGGFRFGGSMAFMSDKGSFFFISDDRNLKYPVTDFGYAIFGVYEFNDVLAIQPEINFLRKGASYRKKDEYSVYGTTYSYNFRHDLLSKCIEFPILIKIGNENGKLIIGPSFARTKSAKFTVRNKVNGATQESSNYGIYIKDKSETLLVFGLEITSDRIAEKFPLKWVIDFRIHKSFKEIYNNMFPNISNGDWNQKNVENYNDFMILSFGFRY